MKEDPTVGVTHKKDNNYIVLLLGVQQCSPKDYPVLQELYADEEGTLKAYP